MTIKVRQSNFELLRILCMLGIVTNHVLQNCYPQLHLNAWGACSGMVAFTLVFYAACIVLDKIRIAVCSPLNNWLVRKAICVL